MWFDAIRSQQYCVSKKAGWLEQETNLHIKVPTETYETDYEMLFISGTRGRRKHRNFTCCGVCVCVCVAGSLPVCSRGLIRVSVRQT